jgi:Iap family predicted aminopeptidase
MAKIFYTERDIDDLKARGIDSVEVNDNAVLTDLAVERAMKLGMKIRRHEQSAPQATPSPSVNTYAAYPREVSRTSASDLELKQKIKSMVLARLNGQVDEALLDAVITRVLAGMK